MPKLNSFVGKEFGPTQTNVRIKTKKTFQEEQEKEWDLFCRDSS